ncbi:1,4-dihydroxy-2-naphthoate polyprenyltransferase [Carnobacterium mobile]|uniref:1,4-dihydroxy-2-naphthoate polyprenyltransferase n=1 Tax=Carnobacterium mobile TaxID=2750 RepID=UPI001867A2D3|nr:1,4-dihydroxy-2-naphthoate polyprenyltransferase [Carnobacterium mobile]
MTLKVFLKLVEIQTKIASLFPFLLGILFAQFYFGTINIGNTLLFFLAMLLFDLTTTAINNLMDYQKAKDVSYKENTNIIGQEKIAEKTVIQLILMMLTFASLLGLWLVFRTNILLLFLGGACFIVGIFYTFGPLPISRMPLGEALSGVVMGFGIFFIAVYVNVAPTTLIDLSFHGTTFLLEGNVLTILKIFLVSLPTVFLIANIMLANNTCDLEQDISNHRFTLPFYIGKSNAVLLFNLLMYASYVMVILAVIFRLLHPILLGVLITLIPIRKNLQQFNQRQVKEETFSVAIKNISLFCGVEILLLAVSLGLN